MADVTGTRLARVQLQGHVALDKIYAAIAAAIHAAILRRATPDARGILRLSLPSRAAILSDLGHLLDNARGILMAAIMTAVKDAERVAGIGAPAVTPDLTTALLTTGTVWRSLGTDRPSVISQTGALLVRGIAAGAPASAVANTVRQYFFRRDPKTGLVQHWPGRANMASQHARLILLTETTAAHARTMIRVAQRENVGVRWRLSSAHQKADECSERARRDSGWGSGVYLPSEVPPLPTHPRCRCWLETVPLVRK